jgi:GT2 family glycosyltransferase
MPEHNDRHCAAKVHCFNAGYEKLKNTQYDIIANLDADITFEEDYFEFLLGKFADNPKLGVAGTPFVEGSSHYDYRFTNIEHVSGACQLFRRECFEEIGGYVPIKGGGIDWTAVTTARMKGWQTRTFTEKTCFHHRKIGTGGSGSLTAIFKYGQKNYFLGGHLLWQIFRSLYQMTKKPFIIGGLLLFSGYAWGFLSRMERPVSRELLEFYQHEQIVRLKKILYKLIKRQTG